MTRQAGVGQDRVRRVNLSHVLRALHAGGPRSRAELTAETGLNRSTVAALVAEGEARATGTPGRPSPIVSVRTDRPVVLALDVGVDSLGAALPTDPATTRSSTRDRPDPHPCRQVRLRPVDRRPPRP